MHGYDEGLLLDVDGFVAEGAGEHLHRRDGVLWEPELTSALTGITRSSVIEARRRARLPSARQAPHARRHLHRGRSVLYRHRGEVTPIRELDGRTIGEGKAGPVTKAIQKAFFDVVAGKDKKQRKWLTPVK